MRVSGFIVNCSDNDVKNIYKFGRNAGDKIDGRIDAADERKKIVQFMQGNLSHANTVVYVSPIRPKILSSTPLPDLMFSVVNEYTSKTEEHFCAHSKTFNLAKVIPVKLEEIETEYEFCQALWSRRVDSRASSPAKEELKCPQTTEGWDKCLKGTHLSGKGGFFLIFIFIKSRGFVPEEYCNFASAEKHIKIN